MSRHTDYIPSRSSLAHLDCTTWLEGCPQTCRDRDVPIHFPWLYLFCFFFFSMGFPPPSVGSYCVRVCVGVYVRQSVSGFVPSACACVCAPVRVRVWREEFAWDDRVSLSGFWQTLLRATEFPQMWQTAPLCFPASSIYFAAEVVMESEWLYKNLTTPPHFVLSVQFQHFLSFRFIYWRTYLWFEPVL